MKISKLNLPRFSQNHSWSNFFQWLASVIVIAGIYYSAAQLGILVALPIPPGNVTAVWPASAIALVAVLLLGYRIWPGIWLADALISIPTNIEISHNILKSMLMGGIGSNGSVLEAVLGAFLIRRLIQSKYPFNRTQDVFKFVLIAMLCPALNATLGVTVTCVGNFSQWVDYNSLWYTWWIGDTIAILVLTPMLLTWKQHPRIRLRPWQITEGLFLLIMLLGVGIIAFKLGYPVQYMLIPCLVWAAFRFGQQGATTGIVMVSGMALWGTLQGVGSFVRESLNESLMLLQSFIGVISVTTLVLSAVLLERKKAEEAFAFANEQLELRVYERTAALEQTNNQLLVEIVERKQAEEKLQRSELILRSSTTELKRTLKDLQRTQGQLIQTEKMSSLGQLVAGVAHEINNPVNFIHGNLTYIDNYSQDLINLIQLYQNIYPQTAPEIADLIAEIDLDFLIEDMPKTLNSMKVGTQRIREIVLTLRNFSRLDEAEMKPVNIHSGIDSTLLILQNRLKTKPEYAAIEIIKEYENLPEIECYPGQLNQVFMNILSNALDALDNYQEKRKIIIRTKLLNPDTVAIWIKDNGPGMTESVRQKLFDPFFTTKPVGQGTGLGLSISYQIVVDKHKGNITCNSAPGQGAEFCIEIPINQKLTTQIHTQLN